MDKLCIVTVRNGGKDGYGEDKFLLPAWWPTIWGEVSRKVLRS
jgi:hypothetical protein